MSRGDRDREVVQRTAELLTSSLSLEELFHALCSLLARFVDASAIFIALKDKEGARISYMLQNGVVARLENRRVSQGSSTDTVMRTGQPQLKRRLEDWTQGRIALSIPGHGDRRISAVFVPLKFGTKILGVLSVQSDAEDAYNEDDVALLQTCALYLSVRIHQAQLESQSARLENIALTDSLTGIPNRRSFNQRFGAEWKRAIRHGTGLAVLLVDIDFFKPFNDTYGHVAGDAALQQVANALSSCLSRSEDFFARYGGEEFVAVLADTSLSGALTIAEKMRAAVYDLGIAHSGSMLHRLTISAGVACKIPARGTEPETLVQAADATLYQAKRTGRNRVAGENYRSDAPPAYPSKAYRHNLPLIHGHTFGRAEDLQRLRKLLRSSRLLTITGPAGIGKSREAIEVAWREIGRFRDGAFYVDCATAGDERYLTNKIAATLGIPESSIASPAAGVAEFLQSKRALLVLDNVDGVSRGAAEFLRSLLGTARDVRVLLTCREALLVPGEVSFVLPPLAQADAIALFVDRAKGLCGVNPRDDEKEIIEHICRQLEGLPRALHLAAAQLRAFDLQHLALRLPDRAALGREAMLGFVEWSYNVLAAQEQTLLRNLAVFAGGARLEAIRVVCGVTDALPSLVDKALVTVETTLTGDRYVVPASIRAFALQRSRELDERHAVSKRHAAYFRARAAALQDSYSTRRWRETLEAMLPELDNLRAALTFTVLESSDVLLGAELSCDLVEYWQHQGRNTAGREWIEQLLERPDTQFSKRLQAKLHYGMARLDTARSKRALDAALHSAELYRELGDEAGLAGSLFEAAAAATGIGHSDAADPYLDEALAIAKRIGDVRRMADVLNGKALAQNWRGYTMQARELFEQSLQLFRQLEDDRGIASLLGNLGDLAATAGDYDRAVSLSRQSLAILERLHDAQSTGWQLLNLGAFELKRGNVDAARPALRRALELVREYQDDWLSANCLDCLSRLALVEKDWPRALRLAGFADGVLETMGVPRQPPDQIDYENVLREARDAVGDREADDGMQAGRAMEWSDAVREALQV